MDVESELSKLDGLLEQVTTELQKAGFRAEQAATVAPSQTRGEYTSCIGQHPGRRNIADNTVTQEERKMADNITPVVNETRTSIR